VDFPVTKQRVGHRSTYRRSTLRVAALLPAFNRRWVWGLWLLATVLAVTITNQWFVPGGMIGGGDIFPLTLINPGVWLQRMRYTWDTVYVLGGPSSLTQYLFPALVSRALGVWLPPDGVQHAFFALLFGAQFLAMAFFVLTILPGRRFAAVIAGLFCCFNPVEVLGGPALLGLFLLPYVLFVAALFIRVARGGAPRLLTPLLLLAAACSGFLSINPPTLVVFVIFDALLAVYVIWVHREGGFGVWRRIAILTCLAVLANLYWAIPLHDELFGSGQASVTAVTNVSDLSFVYQRDSILNMFWLNPIWAWTNTSAYPYASEYNGALLIIAVFVPALLAFSSLLNPRISRRVMLPAIVVILALLFICTALHGPWQAVNLFLFQHVPFFWLFRQPDTKFLLYIMILYAPLIGYQAAWLSEIVMRLVQQPLLTVAARGGVLALFAGVFVLSALPFVKGETAGATRGHVSRTGTSPILTNRLAVPKYWFALASFLTGRDPNARILLLPNDDFYAMPYRWGYVSDSVASEIFTNPTLTLTNVQTNYTSSSSTYDGFKGKMLSIVSGASHNSIMPYLAAQGVTYIVQRNDIDTSSSVRHILHPAQIKAFLRSQRGVRFVRSFGQLDLYAVDQRYIVPPVYGVSLSQDDLTRLGRQDSVQQDVAMALGLPIIDARTRRTGQAPQLIHMAWTRENPTRYVVRIDTTTRAQPVALVLSALYNPRWHACIVPTGSAVSPWACWFNGFLVARDHIRPLGFVNGWILDHPGRYTVVLDYGYQHVADLLALLSLLAVGVTIIWAVLPVLYKVMRYLSGLKRRVNGYQAIHP